MATIRLRRHTILRGSALWASLAAFFSVEAAAQPWPTPERPLSEAVAEALRSPFHSGHAAAGPGGGRLLVAAAAPALHLHAGPMGSPRASGALVPATGNAPSQGTVFLWATLASAAGIGGTMWMVDWCESQPGVVNLVSQRDPPPWPEPRWVSSGGDGTPALCAGDTVLLLTGYVATVAMTGGAAKLVGAGLWRSMIGSALGLTGAALGTIVTAQWVDRLAGDEVFFDTSPVFPLAVMSILHGGITALIAD